jgi:hypothetical protein
VGVGTWRKAEMTQMRGDSKDVKIGDDFGLGSVRSCPESGERPAG